MKINPFNNIQNVYRKQMDKQPAKTEAAEAKKDKIEISSEAKIMQQDTKIASERREKVESLKQQVQNGEYKVNPQEVAKKFYDFWNQ